MPPDHAVSAKATRPATVDLVLGVVVLAALCTLRGSDILTALTAAFLLKTLTPWEPR